MSRAITFIGAGAIARAHAAAIDHLPDSETIEIAVVDPNPEAVETFLGETPSATVYDSQQRALDRQLSDQDIVVVAAPPFAHHDPAVAALESGRHVLCEKPLAMNLREAKGMIDAANANNRLLGSCACRHYGSPGTRHVKELIADGVIGERYHMSWIHRGQRSRPGIEYQPRSKWFLDRSRSGGGIVVDWGPYDFSSMADLLEPETITVTDAWTARPATDVDPSGLTFDVETNAGARLIFERDGEAVSVSYERASGTHGQSRHVTEIEGTRGAIRWNWTEVSDTDVTIATDEDGEVVEDVHTVEAGDELTPHDRPLVFFDRRVRDEDAPILTNEQALTPLATIEAIYDAATSGSPQTVAIQPSLELST